MTTKIEDTIVRVFEEYFKDTSEGYCYPPEDEEDYSPAIRREKSFFKDNYSIDEFIQEYLSQDEEFRKLAHNLICEEF